MGKIRTRILGLEEVEKEQKQEQKRRSEEKKSVKKSAKDHKIRAQGMKGGERMTQVEVSDESMKKMEKAKKILEEKTSTAKAAEAKEKKRRAKARSRGKRYQEAKKMVDKKKSYSVSDAIKLLKKMNHAKFVESVELHLNVDKEGIKGEVELPHATGKTVRVVVVDDKVLLNIEKGKLDFDILITHPQFMPKLARFAKVLGPKGLMPNPKAGTISSNPDEVAKKFSKGALRWKAEAKAPLIHQMIGKISLSEKALIENASAFLSSVGKAHIQTAYIKTTMSPSIKIGL